MKICKLSLFAAVLMGFCLPAVAQTMMVVNIPFNFIAAGKSLPAGHYKIERIQHDTSRSWLSISDDHVSRFMLTNPVESPKKAHHPSLVFLQAGGEYSLIQVWSEGHFGRDVLKSKVKQTLVAEGAKYVEIGAE
jgi:hypothetical protein